MPTFRIVIKAIVTGLWAMADSVDDVAEQLSEMEEGTPGFLGFTMSADPSDRTVLFNMYVASADLEQAAKLASEWVRSAIASAGESAWAWAVLVRAEQCEQVPQP